MIDLSQRRICVTGGGGFLGLFVVEGLRRRGCRSVFVVRKRDFDLTKPTDAERMMRDVRPQVLVHLAAVVGGIGANRENPGRFFYENAIMGIELIEQARRHYVQKVVVVGTICAYPKFTPVPFREQDLWNGYPEETNAPYGVAKKVLLVQCQAYRQQYGMNAIYLLPVNLYGPRDNFDPASSHVIPALVRKFEEARRDHVPEVTVWGDGSPTREFLYVQDAAEGIIRATECYDGQEPVNLGSGQEISIADLTKLIANQCGYRGRIVWDTTKPNGQPRRKLDVSRAELLFGWKAVTPFEEGLRRTIDWYRESVTAQPELGGEYPPAPSVRLR
jgi:GDP-L-fucose synthase